MPSSYTTIQGDMWDGICVRLGFAETDMHYLLEANPGHRLTVVFSAGVTLVVPDIPDPEPELPAWKTG